MSNCYIDYICKESNERLEFLGDHILKMVMGRYFYYRYPDDREKFLTDLKIKIEKCSSLHQIGVRLGFKKYLLLSLSVENNTMLGADKGRNDSKYYENAFEAFVGAIVVDHGELGLIYANRFVVNVMENIIDFAELNSIDDNYKDIIVKMYTANKWGKPHLECFEDADTPLNLKVFPTILIVPKDILNNNQLECILDYTTKLKTKYTIPDNVLVAGFGTGRNTKQAQQECFKQAIINLGLKN